MIENRKQHYECTLALEHTPPHVCTLETLVTTPRGCVCQIRDFDADFLSSLLFLER